jgi:hypothetical protein
VVIRDGAAVGEQLAVVVEEHDAVAQESPALFGVAADHRGEVAGLAGGVGARSYVVAHRNHIPFGLPVRYQESLTVFIWLQAFGKCAPTMKSFW